MRLRKEYEIGLYGIRFYDIAWSQPDDTHERGLIAGALENGSLDLWDAQKIAESSR
jgi:hypothetical protein